MVATYDDEVSWLRKQFAKIPNKAKWAREHDLKGGASMLSQHLSGNRPLSLEAAVTYAAGFGVPLATVSKRLAEIQSRASSLPAESDSEASSSRSSHKASQVSISPRSASLALRIDALSKDRRERVYALIDLTLRNFEAEESSPNTKARSRKA